ncbi:hypothetical protein ACFOEK_04620 [Litoribrevibacter euphylliae]|uniref:Polysaccharide biosynthesis protein C-terminal domain-containing protein n=1 Tax=Litoribrevibacter euphylliae TaxID=1834034 RepID=A0ABV7H8Q2_9GAMM
MVSSFINQLCLNFFSRALNVLASLLLTFVVTIELGVDGFGRFIFLYTLVLGIGTFSRFGLSLGLVRWGGFFYGKGNFEKLSETFVEVGLFIFYTALLMTLVVYFVVLGFFEDFNNNELKLMLLTAPFHSFVFCFGAYFKVIGKAHVSPIFENAGIVLMTLVFFYVLSYFPVLSGFSKLDFLTLSFLISTLLFFVISIRQGAAIFKLKASSSFFRVSFFKSYQWKEGMVDYAISDNINYFVQYGIVLVIGFILSDFEVGVFSIILRIALVLSFFVLVFNTLLDPKFSILFSKGDFNKIKSFANLSMLLMCLISAILVPFMLLFSDALLIFFSSDLIEYRNCFYFLLFGQVVNLVTGPTGPLLNMTGNQNKMRDNVLISSLILSILIIPLTLEFSLLGACLSIAISLSLRNALSYLCVRKCLGFYLVPTYTKVD